MIINFHRYIILPVRKMYLLVLLISITFNFATSNDDEIVTTKCLIDLDESLSRCGPFQIDIRELTIPQIQENFRKGRLTTTDLTKCYLNRIAKIDIHLKSVIETNPDAISLANKADKERRTRKNLSLLHGIPILIKDNIGTADGMQTTAGAIALENVKPKQDAEVIKRLRKAGAIILGKANPSEWALDDDIPSGWSGRGGQTISPYVLGEDPSGSSTGSAVSISANLASISLGTETDGSIISPSSRNALVGLKTTIGKVSTRGVIPLSFSNDVVGPMTRSVEDAAILMGAISDIDLKGCNLNISTCLSNKFFKVGVLRYPFWNETDVPLKRIMPNLEACLNNLEKFEFVSVIDPVESPMEEIVIDEEEGLIFGHEFKYSLNNYLKNDVKHFEVKMGRKIFTLADIIKFNEMNPSNEGYNQTTLESSEATDGVQNKTYLATKAKVQKNSVMYLESIIKKYKVDALATPCYSDETSVLYQYGAFAGYPSITVPVGIDNQGMPFGLCLLGRLNSESVLLKLAYFIELSRPIERPVPRFVRL